MDVNKDKMSIEEKQFIKSRLENSAFTSFRSYNYNNEINLIKNNLISAIIKISPSQNLIKTTDRFLEGMFKILSNDAMFERIQFDHDKGLNYALSLEKKFINVLKDLNNKEEITEVDNKRLYPFCCRSGISYGLVKVHKSVIGFYPSV